MSKLEYIISIFFIFLLPKWSHLQGCSQCKLLAEQGSELGERSFGTNINVGILFLMVIPYLIIIIIFREQIKKFIIYKLGKLKRK